MRLTIAYSKIKKRNLVLMNNDTYQRETLSERPIWQPLKSRHAQRLQGKMQQVSQIELDWPMTFYALLGIEGYAWTQAWPLVHLHNELPY